MIVAFDASILIYVIDEQAKPPADPATGNSVDRCRERVAYLLESLQQQNAKIVIPTPALAEVLVRAAKGGSEFLRILSSSKHFRIAPFDERAAVEFAARQAGRIELNRRAPAPTRAKAKFDDQIVAIAAVKGRASSTRTTRTSRSSWATASGSSRLPSFRSHPKTRKAHCHS